MNLVLKSSCTSNLWPDAYMHQGSTHPEQCTEICSWRRFTVQRSLHPGIDFRYCADDSGRRGSTSGFSTGLRSSTHAIPDLNSAHCVLQLDPHLSHIQIHSRKKYTASRHSALLNQLASYHLRLEQSSTDYVIKFRRCLAKRRQVEGISNYLRQTSFVRHSRQ